MKMYFIAALTLLAVSVFSTALYSQTADTEYSYGTIVEVKKDSNEIVVSEYDWDTDSEVVTVYSVDPAAAFEGVGSLAEIEANDYVDIEFLPGESGKKTAKYIMIYKEEPAVEE